MNEFQFQPPCTELSAALPGNTLNSKHHIQNAVSSLVVLTGLGICRNPGLECNADKMSPKRAACTTVKMKFSITEPSAKKCHDWTMQLRNMSPNQKLEWDSSSFHQLINSVSTNSWPIHPIQLFLTSTGHHTLAKGWFSASSVCFILRKQRNLTQSPSLGFFWAHSSRAKMRTGTVWCKAARGLHMLHLPKCLAKAEAQMLKGFSA